MRALNIERSITRRDEKSLNHYLTDISRHDVLSVKEEEDLFLRLQQGDEDALQKIVQHNLRFVVSVAKQYQNTGLSLSDLINEGNIGLIKAARRFDVSRGFKFISYAVWWIRQSILKAIQEKGRKIKVPANQQTLSRKIEQERRAFVQNHNREPNEEELAELTGSTAGAIEKNQLHKGKCQSLDAVVKAGEDTSFLQLMPDTQVPAPDHSLAIEESQKLQVQHLLATLPPREASVLALHFGIGEKRPLSLHDIGQRFGLSRERARQIKDRGIRRLKRKVRAMEAALR